MLWAFFLIVIFVLRLALILSNHARNQPVRPASRRRRSRGESRSGDGVVEPGLKPLSGGMPAETPNFEAVNWNDLEAVYSIVPVAQKHLEAGNTWAAEQLVHEQTMRVAKALGTENPMYSAALRSEALMLVKMDDLDRAIPLLRRASAIPGMNRATDRERIGYMINLAEVLTLRGNLDEAEDVLQECLAKRQAMYGENHSGHVAVYRWQARVLFLAERPEEAQLALTKAMEIDLAKLDQQFVDDLALQAYILAAQKSEPETFFPQWATVEKHQGVGALCHACFTLARFFPAQLSLAVLAALRERLMDDTEQATNVKNLLFTSFKCAQALGQHEQALTFCEELAEQACDDPKEHVNFLLGLARAQDTAHKPDQCAATYQQATAEAAETGDWELKSHAERGYADWLMQVGQNEKANSQFLAAIASAEQSKDIVILAWAQACYAVFLHHERKYEDAADLLVQAVPKLPARHPELISAKAHLAFAEQQVECDCHSGGHETMRGAILADLGEKLPAELVQRVTVNLRNAEEPIRVTLDDGLSPEQTDLLQRATSHVWTQVRHGLR